MKVADIAVIHNGNARVIDILDEFVIPGDRACLTVNPVVVVGECGTGKSYILKTLADALGFREGFQEVKYMRCEEFVNSYIEALKSDILPNFRNRMTMGVKAFLVDDVDYLVERSAATFEFTQCIDEMMHDRIKIVLTSSVPIEELRKKCVTKQFGSKVAQGVEIKLSRPYAEGCSAIINRILERARRTLPQATIESIVDSFDGDLHSLVGQVHNAMLDAHLEQKHEIKK